jgi:hypothetical protein
MADTVENVPVDIGRIRVTMTVFDSQAAMFVVNIGRFSFGLSCDFCGETNEDANSPSRFKTALFSGNLAKQAAALGPMFDVSIVPDKEPTSSGYRLTSHRGLESQAGFLLDQFSVDLSESDLAMIFTQMRHLVVLPPKEAPMLKAEKSD